MNIEHLKQGIFAVVGLRLRSLRYVERVRKNLWLINPGEEDEHLLLMILSPSASVRKKIAMSVDMNAIASQARDAAYEWLDRFFTARLEA